MSAFLQLNKYTTKEDILDAPYIVQSLKDDPDKMLRYGVEYESLPLVQLALEHSANPNHKDGRLIDKAIYKGYAPIFRLLIEAGGTLQQRHIFDAADFNADEIVTYMLIERDFEVDESTEENIKNLHANGDGLFATQMIEKQKLNRKLKNKQQADENNLKEKTRKPNF